MNTLNDLDKFHSINRTRVDSIKNDLIKTQTAFELRELRKHSELTHAEVTDRLGIEQHHISQLETGDLRNIKISTLQKYVEALGADLDITIVTPDGERVSLCLTHDGEHQPRSS